MPAMLLRDAPCEMLAQEALKNSDVLPSVARDDRVFVFKALLGVLSHEERSRARPALTRVREHSGGFAT